MALERVSWLLDDVMTLAQDYQRWFPDEKIVGNAPPRRHVFESVDLHGIGTDFVFCDV